jgi:prevent-host-death family protein
MRTQPVSFVKAHLAEVIDNVRESHDPLVITQNGASTAVLVDHESYERMRQGMLLLKFIAMGEQDIAKGRTVPQAEVFRKLHRRLKARAVKEERDRHP